jgi:hypothetical protein
MFAQYLWLYWLPLLFLPNLGFAQPTPFGTLTISDFLIGPYLLVVYHAGRQLPRVHHLNVHALIPLLGIFLWWAAVSTLLIPLRYEYPSNYYLQFGLLKLGKLSLYGLAGVLTARALARAENREPFYWSILAAGILLGGTLLLSANNLEAIGVTEASGSQVYQENPTSVMMGILIAFVVGAIITARASRLWRRYATVGVVVMLLGFVMAEGRGGWLAAAAAVVYIFSRIDLKRTVSATLLGTAVILFAYNQYPDFKYQVDRTLQPDQEYLDQYDIGVMGVDDGARWSILLAEAPKVAQSPVFGRGFFHRGGQSGLFSTGSHNFFLQMFLETGVLGGMLILAVFRRMWHQAGALAAVKAPLYLPVRAALVAAFVGGLSGEYFYGGLVLFTLFLVYAPVGSLVASPDTASIFGVGLSHTLRRVAAKPQPITDASTRVE